jgi:hypothetical protein
MVTARLAASKSVITMNIENVETAVMTLATSVATTKIVEKSCSIGRFSNHIVSGSGGDFMRSIAQEVFGIPPERVIGSASALEYTSDDTGGTLTHKAKLGFLDDGPQKPIQIWTRVGRRPLVAGGNSNGDLPMLDFTQHQDKPSLRLLVRHDDADREFAYTSGAEQAMKKANTSGWTVVSMKDDFATVFGAGREP